MKYCFETFDVIAVIAELQERLSGYRLVNIYDINTKTYLFKFSSTIDDSKPILLIESGSRLHLTHFSWPKGMMPLSFTMKLRKHIRNKKLAHIKQLGMDRLVDLQFGFGENAFHLIVELYGKGNMFLTDANFTILHLLRLRTDVNQDVRYITRERFPIELARPIPKCLENIEDEDCLQKLIKTVNDSLASVSGPWSVNTSNKTSELRSVSNVLSTAFPCGTGLIDHCCHLANLSGSLKKREDASCDKVGVRTADDNMCTNSSNYQLEYSQRIAVALRDALLLLRERNKGDEKLAVILGHFDRNQQGKHALYESYYPFKFEQFSSRSAMHFASFNEAVDEFYSSLESQRTEVQIMQTERKAVKKMDNVRKDQEYRLKKLQDEQMADNFKAQLLELNAELVDKTLLSLNYAIANQTSWNTLEAVVKEQKLRGDPVISCIQRLQLETNQAVVLLRNPYADTEDEANRFEEVMIDLGCNALQNAKRYYDHKKMAKNKEQKTIVGTKLAFKAASKKAEKSKKLVEGVSKICKAREPFWFEKFHWFISSENYLVLAGRDAGQNENLIKRYFDPPDIYVHADVHGASSVIVKARPLQPNEVPDPGGEPLPTPPMKTLIEAGQMAVCLSKAWAAKMITNAWWVRYDQVSKTAPSGEYLTTGSFIIRGRKNLLPRCHLNYGFGILFKLDEDSQHRHLHERFIDTETSEDVERTMRKYELQPSRTVEDSDEDDATKAFENISLNFDINRAVKLAATCRQVPLHAITESDQLKIGGSTSTRVQNKLEKNNAHDGYHVEGKHQQSVMKKTEGVLKRGQKSKMKRIKQKYIDQDEEERQMRLVILQGPNAKPSAMHTAGSKTAVIEEVEKDVSRLSTESIESDDSAAPNLVNREANAEEGNEAIHESCNVVNRNLSRGWQEVVDSLTGMPQLDDTILFALPFCAPYSAIEKYKYKAKLIPGTQKRGKVTKFAISHFASHPLVTEVEKQLIHSIREEDTCRMLPGAVKITFPSSVATSVTGNDSIR